MSDASHDEFIAELEDMFGLEGYARWFKLLEAIAIQMDETDRCSVAYPVQKWLRILKCKRKVLETFLVYSENKLKINTKTTGNILEIEIPKLSKLRDNYSKNLQATDNKLASKEVEVEVEVEVEHKKHLGKKSYSTDFEEFWKAYPRKENKKKAYDAWKRLNGNVPDDLISIVEKQKGWSKWKEGFIPHAATWLNGHRWEDEPPPKKKGKYDWMEEIE